MKTDRPVLLAVPLPVAESIASYLFTRPYSEVHQLIAALQGCKAIPEPEPREKACSPATPVNE